MKTFLVYSSVLLGLGVITLFMMGCATNPKRPYRQYPPEWCKHTNAGPCQK